MLFHPPLSSEYKDFPAIGDAAWHQSCLQASTLLRQAKFGNKIEKLHSKNECQEIS